MTEYRVAAEADVNSLGAAIAGALADNPAAPVSLQCIGPRSVNNGVKAVAAAKHMMMSDGWKIQLVMIPRFISKVLRGQEVTAMELLVRLEQVTEDEDQTNRQPDVSPA